MHTFNLPRGSSGQLSPRESFGALHARSGALFSGHSTCSILNRTSSLSISIGGPEENFLGCEIEAFDPTTGEILGVAVPLEQLSIQTFSHVYKGYFAEGPLQGQLTAIKILTTGFMHTSSKAAEVLDRLYKREVTSLSKLSHPNIVQLLAVGRVAPRHMGGGMMHVGSLVGDVSSPGGPAGAAAAAAAAADGSSHHVLLLQWMPGGDARSLVDQAMRPMDEAAAGSIILPVARALQACHSAGIVHRDLKAGNVLLAPGIGKVCLADWGISVPVSESSRSMHATGSQVRAPAAVGTEFWCAPEIERGLPHDQASDIFSLAMTFVELITGRDPKYDNSAAGIRSLNLPESGFLPENMSPEARSWVAPCLSLHPEDRPNISQLLANEFFTEVARQVEEAAREMERSSHASSHLPLVPMGQQELLLEEAKERSSPGNETAAEQGPSSRGIHSQQGPQRTKKKKRRGLFCSCFYPRSLSPSGSDAEDDGNTQQGPFYHQQQQQQQVGDGIEWVRDGGQTSEHGINGAPQGGSLQPNQDTSRQHPPHLSAHPLHGKGSPQHSQSHYQQHDALEEGTSPPPARQPSRSVSGQHTADNPLELVRGASEYSTRRGSTGSSLVEGGSMSRVSLQQRVLKRQGPHNPYQPPPFMFVERMAGAGLDGMRRVKQEDRGRAHRGDGIDGGGDRAELGGGGLSASVGVSALHADDTCKGHLKGDAQQQQKSHQQEQGGEGQSGSRGLLPVVSFPDRHPSSHVPVVPTTTSISSPGQFPVPSGPGGMQAIPLSSNENLSAPAAPGAHAGTSRSAPGNSTAAAAAGAQVEHAEGQTTAAHIALTSRMPDSEHTAEPGATPPPPPPARTDGGYHSHNSRAVVAPRTSFSNTNGNVSSSGDGLHSSEPHLLQPTNTMAGGPAAGTQGAGQQQQQQQQQQQAHTRQQQQLQQLQLQQQRAAALGVRGPLVLLGPRGVTGHSQLQQQHGPVALLPPAPRSTPLQGSGRGSSSYSGTRSHPAYHYHGEGGPFPRSTGAISKRASSSLHAPQVPPPRLATPAASPFVHAPNSPALQFPYQPSSFPPPAWTDPSHSSGSSGGSGRSSLHGLLGLLGGQHLSTGVRASSFSSVHGSTQSTSGASLREELKAHIQESGGGGGRLLLAPRRSLDPRTVRLSGGSINIRGYDPRTLDPQATSSSSSSSRSTSVSQLVALPLPEPPSSSSSTFAAPNSTANSSGGPVHIRSGSRGVYRGGLSGEHALAPKAPPFYISTHYAQQQGLHSVRSSSSTSRRASSSMLGVGGFGRCSWGRSTNSRLTDLDSGSNLSGRASLLSGPQLSYSSRSSRGGGGHLAYYPQSWERLSTGNVSSGSGGARATGAMVPMMGVVMEEDRVFQGEPLLEPQLQLNSSSGGSNVRSTPQFQRSSSRLGRIVSSGSNAQQLAPRRSLPTPGGGAGVGGFEEGMQVVEENGEEREGGKGEAVAEGSLGHATACERWDAYAARELLGPDLDFHMLLCMDRRDFDPAAAAAAVDERVASAASTAAGAAAAAAAAAAVEAGVTAGGADEAGDVWSREQHQQQQARLEQTWQYWHSQAQWYFGQLRQKQQKGKQQVGVHKLAKGGPHSARAPPHSSAGEQEHGTAPPPTANAAVKEAARSSNANPEEDGHLLVTAAMAASAPLHHLLGQQERKEELALSACAPVSDPNDAPDARHAAEVQLAVKQQHRQPAGGDSCVLS